MNSLTPKQCALANLKSCRDFLRQAEITPALCCPKSVRAAKARLPKLIAKAASFGA